MTKEQKVRALHKAAEIIGKPSYGLGICNALYAVGASEVGSAFHELFVPENDAGVFYMELDDGTYSGKRITKAKATSRRLTAIAFLIAMVEAGDL